MARTLTESALLTGRNARAKLPAGVHWRSIDPETHLGYRKAANGGKWLVRFYKGGQRYGQITLGTADDEIDEGTLTYAKAVAAARKAVEGARAEERAKRDGVAPTVRSVVEAYTSMRNARDSAWADREVRSDACRRLTLHVLSAPLADVGLSELEASDLKAWRQALPQNLKATTIARLINDLRAALKFYHEEHWKKLPATFLAELKSGFSTKQQRDGGTTMASRARDNQILSTVVVGQIIGAAQAVDARDGWDGDLARLIIVLAATGARFSQVRRILVRDVRRGAIVVPPSRKGVRWEEKVSATAPVGPDVMHALAPALVGRDGDEPLLMRFYHTRTERLEWVRGDRRAWQRAPDLTLHWGLILKQAGLDKTVVPYALRHTSIVRGLTAKLPAILVAKQHDTSVEMIEAHYGKYISDAMSDLVAQAVVPLIPPAAASNVLALVREG